MAAHGCFNRGPAFKGDNYVSKALVGTILDAFWPKCGAESHKTRRVFHFLHRDRQRGPKQGDVILDRAYTTRATTARTAARAAVKFVPDLRLIDGPS